MLLLGSFGGQTGLNFCQLAILFGRPLLCYFVHFSATLQQYSRPYSLQNFYLHNLAQRCLYTLQLSNFLNNDFSSLKVRKPHQHYSRDISQQLQILSSPVKTHEISNLRLFGLPCPLYSIVIYSMFTLHSTKRAKQRLFSQIFLLYDTIGVKDIPGYRTVYKIYPQSCESSTALSLSLVQAINSGPAS